jgi:signal transduction histidine kinase
LEQQKQDLEQKNAQLRKLEKLRDDLVHMIVHDLKSPLVGISGFMELLGSTGHLDERQHSYLDKAAGSASTLLNMINSLLDVSRLESGSLTLNRAEHDMRRIIDGAIENLGSQTLGRDIRRTEPDEPISVNCDSELIERVVINLLTNALRYSPVEAPIEVIVAREDDTIVVRVKDFGQGIPVEFRETVFEKFGQVQLRQNRQKYSTGLGLTFCKLAVEAHQGRIGVESEVGKGSEFHFSLPVRV